MRIVSLLPSATEIVCSIGLRPNLVGVSHECDYPASVQDLPVVTQSLIDGSLPSADIDALVRERLQTEKALYSLKFDVLENLRPDLIVTQALCDVCAVSGAEVESASFKLPGQPKVVNLEPSSLEEVFETVELVGSATGHQEPARKTVSALRQRVAHIQEQSEKILVENRPRVAVLEWLHPLFNAGHWTPQLVDFAGGIDCLGNPFEPSVKIELHQLEESDPDVILVALCGFDTERSMQDVVQMRSKPEWSALRAVRNNNVFVTDGNSYFSRSGPRLVDSLEILAHLLHPGVHSAGPAPAIRCE